MRQISSLSPILGTAKLASARRLGHAVETVSTFARVSFLALAVAAPCVSAKAAEVVPEARALIAQVTGPSTLLDRTALGQAFSDYCNAVLRAIPRNSPREQECLVGELNSTDHSRIFRAATSPEYARDKLLVAFHSCVSSATLILRAGNTPNETTGWVALALAFNDDDTLLSSARAIGIMQPPTPDAFALGWLTIWRGGALAAASRQQVAR